MTSEVKRRSKTARDRGAVVAHHFARGGDCVVFVVDDAPGFAFIDDFGHRAATPRDDRRAARHRFDHHDAEGFGPIDREQQRRRVAEELRLLRIADLADERDIGRAVQQRRDLALVVRLVLAVDLRRDLQGHAHASCDGDRAIHALLRRNAAEEREIVAARIRIERQQRRRQTVVDRADPVRIAQRAALVVGNRRERELMPATVHARQILEIQAAMQRRQRVRRAIFEEGELDHVDVEVQHVELIHAAPHIEQHAHVRGEVRLEDGGIQADRLVAHRHQLGARLCFGRCEQRDIVAGVHQCIGEPGHHPFRAAVQFRRYRFIERGDLRDFQVAFPRAARQRRPLGTLATRPYTKRACKRLRVRQAHSVSRNRR